MKADHSIVLAVFWSFWFVVWSHYLPYLYSQVNNETGDGAGVAITMTVIFILGTLFTIFAIPAILADKEDE